MNNKYKFEDFEIDFRKPLGKGGFGDVYKAIEKKTGKLYAIKRIPINNLEDEEINNMLNMNICENSIKYYGYFKEENLIYLIMELCDCNLNQIINKKKLNIKEIKEILGQLNNAFKIMYDNKIIHRDIKPENILIKKLENNKYLYKLTDYGLSRKLNKSNKASTNADTNDILYLK